MELPMFINSVQIDWNKIEKNSYLKKIEALKGIETLTFNSPITFFVGENGTGKSTLLEAIAIAYGFNPEGGSRDYSFSTNDTHSELYKALRLSRGIVGEHGGYFLRAESFYNVATKAEDYFKGSSYHRQSHGESFLAMVQRYFKQRGIYILDEPEAALSPQRQLALLLEINRCLKKGSQFIIVTHSPILLAYPGAEIFTFDDGSIHTCDYEETDSYKVTSLFMEKRKQILDELLKEIE